MSNPNDVALARPSSTVVLVRDTRAGAEVLLVRRRAGAAFGAAWAFPGGVLEPADTSAVAHVAGVTAGEASRVLDTKTAALEYYSAAIRELFEETGVLLAATCPAMDTLAGLRDRLNAGEATWDRLLATEGLRLDGRALRYFSHWITPDALPKRYSTRFFLARMPDGQEASHDDCELTGLEWRRPAQALRSAEAGEISIPFPTARTLEQLQQRKDVDDLLSWAADRSAAGVQAIHPVIDRRGGRAVPVVAE